MFLERLRKYIFGDSTSEIQQRVLAMMAAQVEKNDEMLRLTRLVRPIFHRAYMRHLEGGDCFEVSEAEMVDLRQCHEIVSGKPETPDSIYGMKLKVKESVS